MTAIAFIAGLVAAVFSSRVKYQKRRAEAYKSKVKSAEKTIHTLITTNSVIDRANEQQQQAIEEEKAREETGDRSYFSDS